MGSNKANLDNQTVVQPKETLSPPEPPPFQRKLLFRRTQLIGIPLLMILPILGLFGLFGETFTTAHAANEQLSMQVEYATRYRNKMNNDLRVTITNLSSQSPVTVTVAFNRSYIDQFSNESFLPDVKRITEQEVEVELKEIRSGQTQVVKVGLKGERYWHHTGVISASIPGGEPVQLEIGTTIYP